jgi:hypothetical protein
MYPMGALSNKFRAASLSKTLEGAALLRWAAGRRVRIRIHTSAATHSKPGRKTIHPSYRQKPFYRIVLVRLA